jgi:hypothetical protein
MNVEFAHQLSEHEEREERKRERWHELVEIVEVVMLALVAVATAWSGFQAAKWDSRQSLLYGESSRLRFQADSNSTKGGQQLVADSAMFNNWLNAHDAGNDKLAAQFERRFSTDYHAAFEAWLRTDPFTNPNAPPGPGFMEGFDNPLNVQAQQQNDEASTKFDEGTAARENADKYVRDTVLFASVLFLIAMAQRMKGRGTRIALSCVAGVLLVFVIASVAVLPRA